MAEQQTWVNCSSCGKPLRESDELFELRKVTEEAAETLERWARAGPHAKQNPGGLVELAGFLRASSSLKASSDALRDEVDGPEFSK